jgi:ribonuclease J
MGTGHDNILIAEDGDRLVLDDDGLRTVGRVPADYIYVHGTVGDIGTGVLADRRILADEGVVAIIVCVDRKNRKLVAGPQIATRGWIYEQESGDLIKDLAARVKGAVQTALADKADQNQLEKAVRKSAGSFVADKTRRRPMIVPVVLDA